MVIWFLFDLRRVSDRLISRAKEIQQEPVESDEIEKFRKQAKYYEAWNRAEDEIFRELGEEGVLNYQKEALYELDNYFKKDLLLITLPNSRDYSISAGGRRMIENFTNDRPHTYYFDNVADVYSLEDAVFPQDGHPNKKGHELIADSVFDYLARNDFISCDLTF